jgi:DtxR family Mn-dependent transcriptional regulator
LNQAIEDYIKLIYELELRSSEPYIKTKMIADHFSYTVQSVNEMIKKLDEKKLINFKPYKGIKLTKKGKLEALRMIRAHRIWEVFLSDKLGLSWELLHEEAEKLEHVMSDDVLDRLYDYLGQPKACKHGNPIPTKEGYIPSLDYTTLWDHPVHEQFTVKRVLDQKPLLVFLANHQIKLEDQIEIMTKEPITKLLTIKHKNLTITLSQVIAESIYGVKS